MSWAERRLRQKNAVILRTIHLFAHITTAINHSHFMWACARDQCLRFVFTIQLFSLSMPRSRQSRRRTPSNLGPMPDPVSLRTVLVASLCNPSGLLLPPIPWGLFCHDYPRKPSSNLCTLLHPARKRTRSLWYRMIELPNISRKTAGSLVWSVFFGTSRGPEFVSSRR